MSIMDKWIKRTIVNGGYIGNNIKKPEKVPKPAGLSKIGVRRCRVCGKLTSVTTIPRYQLCQSCRLKGIKID